MVLLFILAAAIPSAMTTNTVVTVIGAKIADRVESRRLARTLYEVEQDLTMIEADPAAVDVWVVSECGTDALNVFGEVTLGGRRLRATSRQMELVSEYLDDEDDRRLRPFLTKLVVQTRAMS